MKKILFFIAVIYGLVPPETYGDFVTCNKADKDIYISKVQREVRNYAQVWSSVGWLKIEKDSCLPVNDGPGVEFVGFMSVIFQDNNGEAEVFLPKKNSDSDRITIDERFYCIKGVAFRREESSLKLHQECPEGWYPQLFNIYIHVPRNLRFTLDING